MAVVIAELSMSLDGFIADRADQVGPLFDWYGNGPVETPTAFPDRFSFRTSPASAGYLQQAMRNVKALICGRRLFDIGNWGENGQPFGVPVFVVTHSVPQGWPRADAPTPVTFVTDGVRSAVAQASAVAGHDGWIGVGGPNVIGQCLRAGLLDEVRINLVPVLLGDGIRYFDQLEFTAPELLDGPTVVEGDRVTHLVYRIRR
jgi:dihydrofolate reductase